ncbi:histidine phosphatase family protein [Lampropedia cohaerens]
MNAPHTPMEEAPDELPMAATRLTLIRHGETDWNHSARIQGHTDIPLNARGRQQAGRMAQALADSAPDVIYSSDLQRAWQTAQALQETTSAPLLPNADLRERCFGVLQGQTIEQICAQDATLAKAFKSRDAAYRPPGGESMQMFRDRVLHAVDQLAARHAGQHIVLVAHGGVLDILYRHAAGLDLQVSRSWVIENTSIHRMLWAAGTLTLLAWGDVAHLDALAETAPQHYV